MEAGLEKGQRFSVEHDTGLGSFSTASGYSILGKRYVTKGTNRTRRGSERGIRGEKHIGTKREDPWGQIRGYDRSLPRLQMVDG